MVHYFITNIRHVTQRPPVCVNCGKDALKDDAVTDEAVHEFIDVFSDFIVETSARGGLRKGKIERDGWVFTDD